MRSRIKPPRFFIPERGIMTDLNSELGSTISSIIKDKIGNPYMGTFLTTFLVKNYDILIKLIVNIQKDDSVKNFNEALYSDWTRIGYPLLFMFAFPLIIQNIGNFLIIWFSEITYRIIENRKEKERNKIHKLNSEKHEILNDNLNGQIKYILDHSIPIINFLKNCIREPREDVLAIFPSKEKLNIGEYVSYVEEENKIIPFSNKFTLIGKVKLEIKPQLYVVVGIPTS